ncbi:glycosyl hydrolase family 18 protein [Desulfosporosinus sp. Sb-LF]|uniref:glycosyl hydrolase family 18 protein n=1 Tax=Desulfosporosinus sp. Sb-LF TaxID=2560027 RepID=UPI00107F45F6|nr:glycosyl hydrolase family 18 protein [Desulfosporosinus sp. Sb-LF]TGE33568.1 LysM peptidoglycan-binding domain-containing protein [Desulfosporosinus sp. Sb-LF]
MYIHVVERGDTLWILVNRYGVTIRQINTANGLSDSDKLVIGQSLVIPTANEYHTVKQGESLWQIAKLYGTTPERIAQVNQLVNLNLIQVGQRLKLPTKTKPFKEVNAYLINQGSTGQKMIEQIGQHLTYLCPFSYEVRSDGSLKTLNDLNLLTISRSKQVAPLMSISNLDDKGFNSAIVHTVLTDLPVQQSLIDNIVRIMAEKGFRGLNVDFEYVPSGDRERYNYFLQQLVNRLHPRGYSVSSALAPKLSSIQKGLLYEAHDYPIHGQLLDFMVLMTYEWGWAGGPPMAISPLNMVKRVVDYAVTVIPNSKIMIGIALYARDWTLPYVKGGPNARTFSPQYAIQLATRYHAPIQYDQLSQSPFFEYTDEQGRNHVVWFEDARSMQAKFNLVKDYNLRGISYWVLPASFEQVWYVQEDSFEVIKL